MRLGNPQIDLQNAVDAYEKLNEQINNLPTIEKKYYIEILKKAKETIEFYRQKIPEIQSKEISKLIIKELEQFLIKKENKTKQFKPISEEIERLLRKRYRVSLKKEVMTIQELIDDNYITHKHKFKYKNRNRFLLMFDDKSGIEVPAKIFKWFPENN